MNILIGLGNPGKEYVLTRHNVGWLFLDYVRERLELPVFEEKKKLLSQVSKSKGLLLAKPQTYMNRSGEAVQKVLGFSNIEQDVQGYRQLVVAHDDLDLEFGRFKVQFGHGPKIHNGINSIRQVLKTDQFWSVRIGVDGRAGDRSIPGRNYVLTSFTSPERAQLKEIFEQVWAELEKKLGE